MDILITVVVCIALHCLIRKKESHKILSLEKRIREEERRNQIKIKHMDDENAIYKRETTRDGRIAVSRTSFIENHLCKSVVKIFDSPNKQQNISKADALVNKLKETIK